jgi:hypothetical protein
MWTTGSGRRAARGRATLTGRFSAAFRAAGLTAARFEAGFFLDAALATRLRAGFFEGLAFRAGARFAGFLPRPERPAALRFAIPASFLALTVLR